MNGKVRKVILREALHLRTWCEEDTEEALGEVIQGEMLHQQHSITKTLETVVVRATGHWVLLVIPCCGDKDLDEPQSARSQHWRSSALHVRAHHTLQAATRETAFCRSRTMGKIECCRKRTIKEHWKQKRKKKKNPSFSIFLPCSSKRQELISCHLQKRNIYNLPLWSHGTQKRIKLGQRDNKMKHGIFIFIT